MMGKAGSSSFVRYHRVVPIVKDDFAAHFVDEINFVRLALVVVPIIYSLTKLVLLLCVTVIKPRF